MLALSHKHFPWPIFHTTDLDILAITSSERSRQKVPFLIFKDDIKLKRNLRNFRGNAMAHGTIDKNRQQPGEIAY